MWKIEKQHPGWGLGIFLFEALPPEPLDGAPPPTRARICTPTDRFTPSFTPAAGPSGWPQSGWPQRLAPAAGPSGGPQRRAPAAGPSGGPQRLRGAGTGRGPHRTCSRCPSSEPSEPGRRRRTSGYDFAGAGRLPFVCGLCPPHHRLLGRQGSRIVPKMCRAATGPVGADGADARKIQVRCHCCVRCSPDERTDGRTNERTDRQTDRQEDRQTNKQTNKHTSKQASKVSGCVAGLLRGLVAPAAP
eukprot:gene3360-biopygen8188